MLRSTLSLSLLSCIALAACSTTTTQTNVSTCSAPQALTQLSGVYEADNIGINKLGKHIGTSTLTLDVDPDGVIQGSRSWSSDKHQGHTADGTITKGDSEELIGVVDASTCAIGLADIDELGTYRGQLRSDGAIDLILLAPGEHPLAIRNTYKRR